MKLTNYLDEFSLHDLRIKIYNYFKMNNKLALELNELVMICYNDYESSRSGWGKKLSSEEYKIEKFQYYGTSDHADINFFYKLHNVDLLVKHKLYSTSGWRPTHKFTIDDFEDKYCINKFPQLKDEFERHLAHDIYVISHTKVNDTDFMNFCVSLLKYTSVPVIFTVDEITYLKLFELHYDLVMSIFKRRFDV